MITIDLDGTTLGVTFDKYVSNGRTCIDLFEKSTGEPFMCATVNIMAIKLDEDEVIIKDYGENEGIHQLLMDNGVVGPKLYPARCGMTFATVCKLLKQE